MTILLLEDEITTEMADQKIHVLLVEDNPGDVRLIRNLLTEAPSVQFTWEHVEQLNVATDLLRQEPFDVVLLDLSLPDSQGLDTFKRLYPHAICLPIVLLVTMNEEPLALQAVQAGAQDYLVKKQVTGEHLIRALRHAIDRKQTETALRGKVRELTGMAARLEQAIRIGDELNNSIRTIMLSIESLLAQISPTDLKYPDLQAAQGEVHRMGRLVANLRGSGRHNSSQILQAGAPEEIEDTPGLIQYLQAHKVTPIHNHETYFFQASESGTAGYILRGASINELVARIHHMIHEGVQIPRTLGPRVLNEYLEQIKTGGIPSYQELSLRERQVLRQIARGRTNKEIAKRLSISVRTVERHRSSIMNKLGLQNRAELVAYAVQQGLFSGEDEK